MALSTAFELIKQLNNGILKGAKELAKQEGMTGGETVFLMNTTAGKVLFDVADRQELDETLVKVTGDVIQGLLLKPLYGVAGIGFFIDVGLLTSGNSLGNLFLDAYIGIKNTSFSQGYIYVPNGTGIAVSGIGAFGIGESYFRVTTVTENGRTRIATDTNGLYIGAEVISKSMYESVHPDYNDLRKAKIDILNKIDNITQSFNPDHLVEFNDGVLKVTFPDGHIEAEDLEGGNNDITGGDKNDTLVGNTGADTLNGNAGNDYLEGGIGSDTLHGGTGSDTLKGGEGNDRLMGGDGMDLLEGGTDDDTLLGGDDTSTDILFGGSGQDTLLGQGGDDVLAGGVSWDNLYGEKESDYLLGGSGFDVYYIYSADNKKVA